ncbi:hypothetical protein [Roseofilum casamattae]|uniref:Uncharacterized protein n=1 Tax=Roseofilum casamattae BLCC-M143 TaxID=3022442 RepID=A0ABT7BTF8_9CYAN|nr:hypothetical protein [Roseofilum casamattae]MDJ1182469.1 hypothetical protein [Roseofilum casamattae BLCC-M143]
MNAISTPLPKILNYQTSELILKAIAPSFIAIAMDKIDARSRSHECTMNILFWEN